MCLELPLFVIQDIRPVVDCGRYPLKRRVGDNFEVLADVFKHGHDVIAVLLKYRIWNQTRWEEVPMRHMDNDRWHGEFPLMENNRYCYTIEAFVDCFETWREESLKKIEAGLDVSSELLEGRRIVQDAFDRAADENKSDLLELLRAFDGAQYGDRIELLTGDGAAQLMARHPDRSQSTHYQPELDVVVDRERACCAAWYEMFPRSQGKTPNQSASFQDCEERLPEIKAMGFDVVYLPPIHPIGRVNRKGPNNSLMPSPNDPGCPYAIGSELGGHKAIDPALGTFSDFRHFVATANAMDIEIALDFAIQCAPDHPYVREHPEWFYHRPDGTIKFAENPPKKYEDIYPLDLLCEDRDGLWAELKSIVLFWIQQGVNIFRVDNPHTKPVAFWQWLISEVQRDHPDTIFLSEAFTRPKMMKVLAKAGFTQSYTYFTWRNTKSELTEYLTELTEGEEVEYFRGNFFTNTPDILPWSLQQGGRPVFKSRMLLAATLSPLYGIYNGFELCEKEAIPGKEEYLDSEKYQFKVWDWDRPGNIKKFISQVNRARAANTALQHLRNLRFLYVDNENLIAYNKMTPDRRNIIIVVVNLDPFHAQEGTLSVPVGEFGMGPDEEFVAHDLLTDVGYHWRGERQYIRLDPNVEPAHLLQIRRL